MDHYKLVREIWPLLRKHLLDPNEILPDIQGFTDVDIENIKAAALRSKIEAIDKLQEALRRRDINCFKSFLNALLKNRYNELAMKIMEIAESWSIQLDYQPTAILQRNIPSQLTEIGTVRALRGRSLASIGTPPTSSLSSVTPNISSKTESMGQQASGGTDEDLLTPEMELGDVSCEITDRWAAELSKEKLWRELRKKIQLKKKEEMKIENSDNAGNAFLGELVNRGYRVADLIKLLEGAKFSNFLQVIRIDLGESSYNNLNIDSSPADNRYETVTLGLPPRNDSSSNLEENIQNNVIDSPLQNSSNVSESRSSSRSSSADTPKSENVVDSRKENMDCITLTGHNISYGSEKKSHQKEDQQQQMIPTLSSGSREGTEGSDISPIIRDTQKEIALANKRKGLDSSYSDAYPIEDPEQPFSLGIGSVHQTSPKSTFLDDNLNTSVNFSLEPKETSKKSVDKLSDLNVRTSTQDMPSRPSEPVVHQEEDDAVNQKGSTLMQGINDITKNLEEVGYEKQSYEARPSGSSINIPVQPVAAATEVGNPLAAPESTNASSQFDLFQTETGHQSAENLMGSQQMPGPYVSPVSDDSDAKNLEMEASALHEEVVNQSNTAGYRDIQNSIPDQNHGMENREYDSSLAGQYCYSRGERSWSQGQGHSSDVPTTARESLGRREGSTSGSRSSASNDCPTLNDSLLNEDTLTSNNTS